MSQYPEIQGHSYLPIPAKAYGPVRPSERINALILHYTVSDAASALSVFANQATVSAHYVVGRETTDEYWANAKLMDFMLDKKAKTPKPFAPDLKAPVIQCVDLAARSYHAGESTLMGQPSVNTFSIGIEIANYGPLKFDAKGRLCNDGGTLVKDEDAVLCHNYNPNDRAYNARPIYWHKYPQHQRETILALSKKVIDEYPIYFVAGHSQIAPLRKSDPGPELADIITELNNYIWETKLSPRVKSATANLYRVTADTLNVRMAPDGQPIDSRRLMKGDRVVLVADCKAHMKGSVPFQDVTQWALAYSVDGDGYQGLLGFVHTKYLEQVEQV